MTLLKKKVKRETTGLVREAGRLRPVITIMQPPNLIGFRAKGCRKTYWLTTEVCYSQAVKADVLDRKRQQKRGK